MAPGIGSFIAGKHYDHGGLSLQECLTPWIEIKNTQLNEKPGVKASINSSRWLGLTCKVEVNTDDENIFACLRISAADQNSEICKRKLIKNSKCTLMVDDEYEDHSVVLVLLDEQGELLAKKPVIVGDE